MGINRTLLVVDDEPGILQAYEDCLCAKSDSTLLSSRRPDAAQVPSRPSYQLLLAETGERAIELVTAERHAGRRVAAGFFDMKMPGGIDGLETISKVRQLDSDILCTVVTAYGDRSLDEIGALFVDGHEDEWDFISKPFTTGEVVQKARNMVSSWNRRRREQDMITELRATQQSLLRAERLAVVGQLARQVARELQDPCQALAADLELVSRVMTNFGAYGREHPEASAREALLAWLESSSLSEVFAELPGIVSALARDVRDISSVATELGSFSALEQEQPTAVQVNEIVDKAIEMLNAEPHSAAVEKHYRPLPKTLGNPGQLLHAFCKLLTHATRTLQQQRRADARLVVATSWEQDQIQVRIHPAPSPEPASAQETPWPAAGSSSGLGIALGEVLLAQQNGRLELCAAASERDGMIVRLPVVHPGEMAP